jgi:DNA-binding MarR family transcriptional regulator
MATPEQLTDALNNLIESITHHSMGSFFHFAKARELSPAQMGTLMRLAHGGMRGIMRIGGDMNMTGAAASQMIDRLVQAGLVERCETPDDRRSKQMRLTPLGESTVRECKRSRGSWLSELAARLEPREAELVGEALRILETRMNEMDGAVPDSNCWTDKEKMTR